MNWLLFGIIFIVWAIALPLCIFGLGELIKWQARRPNKRFFAPIPRPGSFSFPALEGRVTDVIENVAGWHTERFEKHGDAKCFVTGPENPGFLEKHLGVRWIGPYATIKIYPKWRWSELQQVEITEDGQKILRYVVVSREEEVSEFFYQFLYPVTLEGAELKGNIKVRITAAFIVLHFHPVRAFYLNKDPVTVFNAMVLSLLRNYVIDKDFDGVKGIQASSPSKAVRDALAKSGQGNVPGDKQDDLFWQKLRDLNGVEIDDETGDLDYEKADPLGLFGKLGSVIVRGEILQVDAVGDAAKAIEAERIAELQGNAAIMIAKKEAQALDERREARKRWVKDTIVDPTGGPGPQVANVLEAEQVKDSKVTVWSKGGGTVIAVSPPESPKK